MTRRYAIYWAPDPGSALDAFGRRWLGRDARTGEPMAPPDVPGMAPEDIARVTTEPRRYGFHATLKPPFVLASGAAERDLIQRLKELAATQQAVEIKGLALADLGGFLALVPRRPSPELSALAGVCVRELDYCRAPPTTQERVRRRAAGLTERQEAYLERWGYPYVFEEFRFHLTLTGRLSDADRRSVSRALAPSLEAFQQSVFRVSALTVFEQPAPAADFISARSFELIGSTAEQSVG